MDSSLKRRLSEMESSSKRTRLDEGVNERLETDKVMVGSRKSPVRFFSITVKFFYQSVSILGSEQVNIVMIVLLFIY